MLYAAAKIATLSEQIVLIYVSKVLGLTDTDQYIAQLHNS